ncbi:MAG: DUF1501 domain-containing protein [Planctomycetes bacterium]|nr:DUF1501 domain-containing protein [Planctomycetota bacterium]
MAWFSSNLTRRNLLRLGAGGVLGWSLPQMLALQATADSNRRSGRAKSVLVILEQGGMSHIDTWDPKPDVVLDHRSPYKPVATRVPGMQFTELLTKTARIADKLAVVRSMHHRNGRVASGHPDGTQYALSGSHPGSAFEMPDIGSMVAHVLGTECRDLPPYIMVPGNHEQAGMTRTGFLPAGTRVFKTGGRDLSAREWNITSNLTRADVPTPRLIGRQHLLESLENRSPGHAGINPGGMDRFYEQAFAMMTSPRVAAAFDYQGEPTKIRDRYGRGHRGACYLVGRKLIEAGVRFVTVDVRWPLTSETPLGGNLNWDHHDYIYTSGTCNLPGAGGGGAGRYGIGHWVMMGSVDHAFSALIEDLDQRGLLDETLVCFITEFGRTPRLNRHQGRDHHVGAYSIAFAGAGVPGGQVIGRSDRDGGYVTDLPFNPENYAVSIYEKLGIDRSLPVYTSSNRPMFIGHGFEPITQLF